MVIYYQGDLVLLGEVVNSFGDLLKGGRIKYPPQITEGRGVIYFSFHKKWLSFCRGKGGGVTHKFSVSILLDLQNP